VLEAAVDRERLPKASASLVIPDDPLAPSVLRAHGLGRPSGDRVYQVWLLRGRDVVPSSVFTVRSDGTGAVGIAQDLEGVDAVLVTRERDGGARAPSEEPVLRIVLEAPTRSLREGLEPADDGAAHAEVVAEHHDVGG
jgi:hypothetical protein